MEEHDVLVRIFREEPGHFDGLRAFFLAWKEINPQKLGQLSRGFMEAVINPDHTDIDVLGELADLLPSDRRSAREKNQREAVLSFLEELTLRLQEPLRAGTIPLEMAEEWSGAMRESLMRIETFNMSPATVIEALYIRMRETARRDADGHAAEALS